MTVVTLIRHGESVWNREARFQGGRDPALSPRGRQQTERLVAHLGASMSQAVAAIYASPLRRAAQTAEPIARAHRVPVIHDPDLREICLGEWEGKTVGEVRASAPGHYEKWLEDPWSFPVPGGEDLRSFERRVIGAIQRMQRERPGSDLIVVSHGGVIKALLCHALGLDTRYLFRFTQENTAVNRIQLAGGIRRVLLLNDTCHLNGGSNGDPYGPLVDGGMAADPAF